MIFSNSFSLFISFCLPHSLSVFAVLLSHYQRFVVFSSKMKREQRSNLPLPEDLVRDILSRLSVKMLCRCKLVCKEWCALIQCPNFVKQHFLHESNRARVLIRRTSYIAADDMIENKYLLSVDETFTKFKQPPHLQMSFTHLIGPLNGVYLVVSETWPLGPAGLLNPAMRQFKPLPLLEHGELGERRRVDFDFGLGLDPLTGDFKVVLMSFCMKFAAVCTSDNDYKSWRFLDGVKPRCRVYIYESANNYLNGVYYWLIYSQSDDVAVLAFDMSTEEFKEIRVMSLADQNVGQNVKWQRGLLALNGDSLALVMMECASRSIYVWTMLDEGHWIRSSKMVLPEDYYYLTPIFFWKNDELLLSALEGSWLILNNSLITYNVRSQEVGGGPVIAREIMELCTCYWYFNYKESLVSLKGRLGNCILWDSSSDSIKDFFKQRI